MTSQATYDARYVNNVLKAWGGGQVLRPLAGGYRNTVYLVDVGGNQFVAKSTRRSEQAVAWLEEVFRIARKAGLITPQLVPSLSGSLVVGDFTLETFLFGTPARKHHLSTLGPILTRFHELSYRLPQRPQFASSVTLLRTDKGGDVDLSAMPPKLAELCRVAWRRYRDQPQTVVHGDINIANLLISPKGIALLDWDEARVDLQLFDTLQLEKLRSHTLTQEQTKLLDAWEVAVSWKIEPVHGLAVAEKLKINN